MLLLQRPVHGHFEWPLYGSLHCRLPVPQGYYQINAQTGTTSPRIWATIVASLVACSLHLHGGAAAAAAAGDRVVATASAVAPCSLCLVAFLRLLARLAPTPPGILSNQCPDRHNVSKNLGHHRCKFGSLQFASLRQRRMSSVQVLASLCQT